MTDQMDKPIIVTLSGRPVTKEFIRKRIWDFMNKGRLVLFPGAYERIPNFKGVDEAAQKLNLLDEFTNAKTVEINPDKALEPARIITLQKEKELYVPIRKIRNGLFKKIELYESTDFKKIVSRKEIDNCERIINVNDKVHIDLLVLGSVVVSKDGYRIGKGRGFGDLEFALLWEMNALDENTVIVTIVHDCQVFDELPNYLFRKYDIPVDYILTPTKIFKVDKKLPRPKGIYWDVLTKRRVEGFVILQTLKEKHESEGRDTTLAQTEEHRGPRRYIQSWRAFKKRRVPNSSTEKESVENKQPKNAEDPTIKRTRKTRASRSTKNQENISPDDRKTDVEVNENMPPKQKKKSRKSNADYSLHVSNINRGVKVKDLKNALTEKGIRPNNITWRGYKGVCVLHYAINNKKKMVDGEEKTEPFAIDSIIEIIQQLKINPDNIDLDVKVVEPITKIETMNITAV